MLNWRPSASCEVLKKRAVILKKIRAFFEARDVCEVETPLLASFGVTDASLENLETQYQDKTHFLQTSPEYHMKRLLCAGMPSIYQLSKAFRDEPSGRHHNPEFTMLEWYRVGFDYHQLMQEVGAFIQAILGLKQTHFYTYQALFLEKLELCPFKASIEELKACVTRFNIDICGTLNEKDEWLSLIMTHIIEPSLVDEGLVFIHDYPPSQASLAIVHKGVARRFECYVDGLEIANGFEELTDATQQKSRFEEDNAARQKEGLKPKSIDGFLLQALSDGMPPTSGVALGVDRLIMLALDFQHISNVISFPSSNA
jgi:lysyl-tRNA synthetase class 2